MAITLRTDIPMPKRMSSKGTKYDFASLTEPGQCLIEDEVINATKVANRLTAAVGNYRRGLGENAPKFSVRVIDLAGKQAVGIWRL